MPAQHVVVDGSNIATEGRSIPSLAQLEDAIAELHLELPDAEVTVVVDATFAHRIDPAEQERFEAESLKGTYVSPPAGAIGRGDAFLLRIAEKVNGVVLSNDSFQEFHGEHPWLFEIGRLLGAMPVKGVGWIFVPRTPVRGPKSRVAVRDADRARQRVEKAIAEATKEATEPEARPQPTGERRGRRALPAQPQAVNDPTTFIAFIAEHPLGREIDAVVDSFSSHGAVVRYGDVRCYVPLSGLGDPPPKSAREVLKKGETVRFVVTALDPNRRGIELALPGVGTVSGRPSEETVAAEVRMARRPRRSSVAGRNEPATEARSPDAAPGLRGELPADALPAADGAVGGEDGAPARPAGRRRGGRQEVEPLEPAVPAVKRTRAKKAAPLAEAAAIPAAPVAPSATSLPTPRRPSPRRSPGRAPVAQPATSAEARTLEVRTAQEQSVATAEKAPSKKAPSKKAPAKKAPAKKAAAKSAAAKKAPAKKAAAKKAPAKKTAALVAGGAVTPDGGRRRPLASDS